MNEGLEDVLKVWKETNELTFPIFYAIDSKILILYSTKPGKLIGHEGETIKDLDKFLKDDGYYFDRVDVKKFKGGVV